jgi:hypothetical protein
MDSIDLTDPAVRARVEELAAHAQRDIEMTLVSNHPELLNADWQSDVRNREVIHDYMAENKLPLTVENMELAFQKTLQAGQLALPMYSAAEEQAFPQMTTTQMKQYLINRYQAPRPPNAAELLPTSGERMWGPETKVMDEEALAALRSNLLGLK